MTEQVSLEAAIECVLRNGPTFETIAGLCKMAVEESQKQADAPVAWMDACDNLFYSEEDAYKTGFQPIQTLMRFPKTTDARRYEPGSFKWNTPPDEPELLKALKRIVDEPNNTMSDGKALKEIIRIARAAIAKATGTQS
jgi:hypothetical protein